MTSSDDRWAARLVQEVADRSPSPPAWSDVLARLAPEPSPAGRSSNRRPWVLVAAAGGVAATSVLGAVVYQRAGTGSDDASIGATTPPTAVPTSGPPVSVSAAPGTTTTETSSTASSSADALFAPSFVPAGFSVVEAGAHDGRWPYAQPRVSVETWISRGTDGAIDGIVRLTASARRVLPNEMPPEPTGVTVHGVVAQANAELGGAVIWDEEGMTLSVSSWGPDAVPIAERSVVSAGAGIALPAGVLPPAFERVDTELNPALVAGRSSDVRWAMSDGSATLAMWSQPNIDGETLDTLGAEPGARRATAGSTEVWLRPMADGSSALWVLGDHVLSASGGVDEATLLEFVASVGRTSEAAFGELVLEASALDEAIPERDRGMFADGLEVSMHSDAAIDVPETSSFGPRSFCMTGDRTFCSGQVTPFTDDGLLTALVGTETINGGAELLVWLGSGRTVTRVYEWDVLAGTELELEFTTAPGTAGSFARASLGPDIESVVVEYQAPGRPYRDTLRVNTGLADPLADVRSPIPQGG